MAATIGSLICGCDPRPTPIDAAPATQDGGQARNDPSQSNDGVAWRWQSHSRRPLEINRDLAENARRAMTQTDTSGPIEIPFVRFEGKGFSYSLELNPATRRSVLVSAHGESIRLEMPGLPVAVTMIDSDRVVVFIRGIPRNRLSLAVFTRAGRLLSLEPLGPTRDVDYMFRAMVRVGELFFAVLYDNKIRKNVLHEWHVKEDGLHRSGRTLALPTFEVPAGANYEMEPPIFLFEGHGGLRITAGTLYAEVSDMHVQKVLRLDRCVRALEAVSVVKGVAALCEAKLGPSEGAKPYRVWSGIEGSGKQWTDVDTVPWALVRDPAHGVKWTAPRTAGDLRSMFMFDISRAQNGGVLDLGADNVEGRVPWGQAYYLWGFMDLLYLAANDRVAYELFGPLIPDVKHRLDLEIYLIDGLLGSELGFKTKGFTIDRSPALFAVQTGRLVVLIERYLREVPNPIALRNYERFRFNMLHLRHHIDSLATQGESERWIAAGKHYLRWPKGSAFFFDGAPVPFNHQNEWAYGVFEVTRQAAANTRARPLQAANDVIEHFLRHVAPDGRLPKSGEWDYWWGRAYEGWTTSDGVSVNRPEYAGDRGKAWISFKTIDVMSVLGAGANQLGDRITVFGQDAVELVERGKIFPFAAYPLVKLGLHPAPPFATVAPYARVGAPWDIGSAVWALFWLANMMEGLALEAGKASTVN